MGGMRYITASIPWMSEYMVYSDESFKEKGSMSEKMVRNEYLGSG